MKQLFLLLLLSIITIPFSSIAMETEQAIEPSLPSPHELTGYQSIGPSSDSDDIEQLNEKTSLITRSRTAWQQRKECCNDIWRHFKWVLPSVPFVLTGMAVLVSSGHSKTQEIVGYSIEGVGVVWFLVWAAANSKKMERERQEQLAAKYDNQYP